MISFLKQKALSASEYLILTKIKKGDKSAFGDLYLKYVDSIFRYIFFRVNQNKEIAEDLAEITFQKAYMNILSYDTSKGSFKSWIFKIAHNSVIDFYRQAGREAPLFENLPSKENIEEKFAQKWNAEAIQKALTKLTDEQRSVVTMRFIEDMNHKEIAEILDKKEDAVRAIQYRALKALRENFKNYEQ